MRVIRENVEREVDASKCEQLLKDGYELVETSGDSKKESPEAKAPGDLLSELYPYALDAGISIDLFWNSSVNEIIDMLESYGRRKEQERKLKIQDDFIIAEVIALNILAPVAGDKEAMPHPWDYYPSFFEAEKKSWEENQLKQQMEDYRERRKAYIAEVNRRRQLGL